MSIIEIFVLIVLVIIFILAIMLLIAVMFINPRDSDMTDIMDKELRENKEKQE